MTLDVLDLCEQMTVENQLNKDAVTHADHRQTILPRLLPCPARMLGCVSIPYSSMCSCPRRLPPPNHICSCRIVLDVVHPHNDWSSCCPGTSHFHRHSLPHLVFFIHSQNMSIPAQHGCLAFDVMCTTQNALLISSLLSFSRSLSPFLVHSSTPDSSISLMAGL